MRLFKERRGQALVEIALVLPLLLIILVGIIDFGRIFHGYIVITQAAREGARWGALGYDDTKITAAVSDATATLDPANLTLSVEPEAASRSPGEQIIVQITYKVYLTTPFLSAVLPNPVQLTAKTIMRIE